MSVLFFPLKCTLWHLYIRWVCFLRWLFKKNLLSIHLSINRKHFSISLSLGFRNKLQNKFWCRIFLNEYVCRVDLLGNWHCVSSPFCCYSFNLVLSLFIMFPIFPFVSSQKSLSILSLDLQQIIMEATCRTHAWVWSGKGTYHSLFHLTV